MKVILISMPDVVPIPPLMNEKAIHMPNLGIASVGGNIDTEHDVYLVDLIRKRRSVKRYLTKIMLKIRPDIVGLSAMTWQFDTCMKVARLIKSLSPEVKIVIGGYHATLMYEKIAVSAEAKWIDFMIRGEGEEACRRLVNGLAGQDDLAEIPSLSYKKDGVFVHNPRAGNLELNTLKLPIRDKRRLTHGYRLIRFKFEVIETSRGCTRSCNFCSMRHMYGPNYRTFPIARVLKDIDDIYFRNKTRWIFITDDNIVLDQARLIDLCDTVIARKYKGLRFIVQAECVAMAGNEQLVAKMAAAGVACVFLGIENVSRRNLSIAGKGDIVESSKKSVENCHKYEMLVLGLLINGFPEDNEVSIRKNYEFAKSIHCDFLYGQFLTPYPKTKIRRQLLEQGLVVNPTAYKKYNGLWANVRTKHLDPEQLQFQSWYQQQVILSSLKLQPHIQKHENRFLVFFLQFIFRPFMKARRQRLLDKYGWKGLYKKAVNHWERMNTFDDL